MEKKTDQTNNENLTVDFYETESIHKKPPFSLIMDISDDNPDELEIEDDIKMGYLWGKYRKKKKNFLLK